MKVTYDREAKALYIKVLEGDYQRRPGVETLIPGVVFFDRTMLGQIIGIEVLGVEGIEPIEGEV